MKSTDKEKKNRPATEASAGRPAAGREKLDFERVEREKLVTAHAEDVDGVVEISLRPSKIDEFIGQENLKENLNIALSAAKKKKRTRRTYPAFRPSGPGENNAGPYRRA